jgi:hypothetical protein
MKRFIVLMSLTLLSASAFASYTYVITDGMDFFDLTLNSGQSLLMTGGGGAFRFNVGRSCNYPRNCSLQSGNLPERWNRNAYCR